MRPNLESLLRYWQPRLRVADWFVKAKYARLDDMGMDDCWGNCTFNIESRTAAILILDPIDRGSNHEFPQDIEETLVHELLHIYFTPFKFVAGTPQGDAEEQAINSLASAFVRIRREGRK